MHWKSDEEFETNLAMSFAGETATIELMATHGHQFEFDGYGAGSIEVFKDIAKKRKRTPDLICALCTQKLEARSKSNLMITMSNSALRPFDHELAADVWVGFLRVSKREKATNLRDPSNWIASKHAYVITIGELSRTRQTTATSATKPVSQGAETYLKWPILLAPCTGTITRINKAEREIDITAADGQITICKPSKGFFLYKGIAVGATVEQSETIMCGVARPLCSQRLKCQGTNLKKIHANLP